MPAGRLGYREWPWQLACSKVYVSGGNYLFSCPTQGGNEFRSTGVPVVAGVPQDGLSLFNTTAKAGFYLPSLVGVDLAEEIEFNVDLIITDDFTTSGDTFALEIAYLECTKGYNGDQLLATGHTALQGNNLSLSGTAASWQNRVVAYGGGLVIPGGTLGSNASALSLLVRPTELTTSGGDPVLLKALVMFYTKEDDA